LDAGYRDPGLESQPRVQGQSLFREHLHAL